MTGSSSPAPDFADDVGAALRRHREAAGRSLRDLADATKLGMRTLEALERNQIEKLPPGIFRRAVVRAYAKEVGLDPEQTVRQFLARYPDDLPPPGIPVGPVADAPVASSNRTALLAVVVAIVLALLAVWWWTAHRAEAPPSRRGLAPQVSPRIVHEVCTVPEVTWT